jgi:hypothetical protein
MKNENEKEFVCRKCSIFLDAQEFENSQLQKQVEHLKSALEKIATGTQPYNEMEAFSFVDTARSIANEAIELNGVF